MSNLTRYWQRKKFVLQTFLAGNPLPSTERTTIANWLNALITTTSGNPARTLEGHLEYELSHPSPGSNGRGGLQEERIEAKHPSPPPPPPAKARDRRSARLAFLVQSAVGGGPDRSGFYIGVADAHGAINNYRNAVRDASMAAADFLDAANNHGHPKVIADALDVLVTANNPPAAEFILNELRELVVAMREAIARGGSGEGSAYWPSTVLSSSS